MATSFVRKSRGKIGKGQNDWGVEIPLGGKGSLEEEKRGAP